MPLASWNPSSRNSRSNEAPALRNNRAVKLAEMTWPEVEALNRDVVLLIPTGSLEQHGPHLPLFTDTLLATRVAEAVETALPEQVLMVPSLWQGASSHHLAFAGTISAEFDAYRSAVDTVIDSLTPHGFRKFFFLNGHGGNTSPLDVALRATKRSQPNLLLAQASYYSFASAKVAEVLEGPLKGIRHACEAETSLMMHLYPHLVRTDRLRNDGLVTEPALTSPILHFDDITEEGSFGYATLATAAKGAAIFSAAVAGVVREVQTLYDGFVLKGIRPTV